MSTYLRKSTQSLHQLGEGIENATEFTLQPHPPTPSGDPTRGASRTASLGDLSHAHTLSLHPRTSLVRSIPPPHANTEPGVSLSGSFLLYRGQALAERSAALGSSIVNSHVCPFPPVALEWRGLTYTVQPRFRGRFFRRRSRPAGSRVILNNISGYVHSGQILGILGTSGSGKTTLINVLARRMTGGAQGRLEGSLLLNRTPVGKGFGRLVGFVSQHQSIYPALTVREQVGFATRLACQPSSHRDRLIDALGLAPSRDTYVGNINFRGVSGGERRRVAVALALARPVPLLILDEPTTGLDSFNALTAVKLLHRLVRGGYAVIIALHQPRTDLFSIFDLLLILTRGEPAYFGPAYEAVDFFGSFGYVCPRGVNFADFLVDLSTVDERSMNVERSKARVSEIVAGYRRSRYAFAAENGGAYREGDVGCRWGGTRGEKGEQQEWLEAGAEALGSLSALPHSFARPDPWPSEEDVKNDGFLGTPERGQYPHLGTSGYPGQHRLPHRRSSHFSSSHGSSGLDDEPEPRSGRECAIPYGYLMEACRPQRQFWLLQVALIAYREVLNIIRTPAVLLVRTIQGILVTFLLGGLFFQRGAHLDQTAPRDLLGVISYILINRAYLPFLVITRSFGGHVRIAFLREQRAGLYSTSAYYVGKVIGEAPLLVFLTLLVTAVLYYIIGLNPGFEHFVVFNAVS